MDDETVLNLAKKRLQTLRAKSYSLGKLAVRSIMKNVRFYLDINDQLGQLKSLPGILREKILQTLLKQRNIDDNGSNGLMAIFPYLLSSRTRYIELNGIMSFACPRRFKTKQILLDQKGTKVTTLNKETKCCVQLLRWIETLAPKVETLIIMQNNPFPETSDPSDEKPVVMPEMLHSLKKMKNLKTLRVDLFKFKENDLLEMCKALPNLHNLNIHTFDSEPYPSPEIYTSSFCNVKQLTFNNNLWLADQCSFSLESFTSLLDLQIKFRFDYRKDLKLSNLLAAPNLKNVKLSGFRVSRKEFRDTLELIKTMQILTKVETLSLMLDKRMVDEDGTEVVAEKEDLKMFKKEVQNARVGGLLQIRFRS